MAISDYPGDLPQLKRRQEIIGQGSAPAGIGLTSEQAKAQRDAEWRKSSIQRQQQFKQGVSDAVGTAADSIASIPLGIGKALANANIYDRPFDYGTPAKEAAKPGATPQQQAGGIMAFDVAQRAADAGIAYNQQMRAMPRPAAPIPDTLKAPSGGMVASGGAGGPAAAQAPRQPVTQPNEQPVERDQFNQIGYGGIVGRMGANGVPEFSNRPQDVQGAGPQRAVGRVGDGIGGGITVGEAGDSRLAIDRFDRANAERGRMNEISRRGGIGEYGGLVVVGQEGLSSDPLKARRQIREAEIRQGDEGLAAGREAIRQRGIEAGMDMNLRERELAGTEQRTRQELEAGELSLAQQRQVAELYARYEQAAPEERAVLAEQIRTLTGKEAPNRFTVVSGGQEYDTAAGALINRPSRVLNNQTGQFVDGAGQQQGRQIPTTPQVGEQRGGYRFKGGNPADQNSWEKV